MTRPYRPHLKGWRVITLEPSEKSEFVIEAVSGSTPDTATAECWGGSIPWLTPKEVTDQYTYRYVEATERGITAMGLKQAGRLWPRGTVMLTKRAPVGFPVINHVGMATNQGFLNFICGPSLLPEFLYYWFRANTPYLDAVANGSTYPELYVGDLFEFEVAVPPISVQRTISRVLGLLDDKIELNRRKNETLEGVVRTFFKSWFVDFDPVRAKVEGRDPGLPKEIKSLFPSRFEDSRLGKIPAGWGNGTMGDVAIHPRRGIQPNEIKPSTPYIGLEHMPRRCIALSEWGAADKLESNKFEFKKGELLFGKLRPYFHKVGVAPLDGICSTDIVVVAPRSEKWFGFVLGHVSSTTFVDFTDAGSIGTKMPRTSWEEMARYAIVMPPEPVAEAFTTQIRPVVDRIIASIHESRTLTALRNTLLPKIISGELRVKDGAHIVLEATV